VVSGRGRPRGGADRLARWLDRGPTTREIVAQWLDEAIPTADATCLDAACGGRSMLATFRPRIGRLTGVDLHEPNEPLEWLDEFRVADLCREPDAFPPRSFDVIHCAFALEHLRDPRRAIQAMHGWLRPGGWLVLTTVNRRHPLVAAYCGLPPVVARPLQRLLKASADDAHPLIARCNTPMAVRAAMVDAGLETIEMRTTGHLSRAWRRRLPAQVLGIAGDLATRDRPARRSTIVARGRRPRSE